MNKLTIVVDVEWIDRPEIQALRDKGHQVQLSSDPDTIDLFLSKRAWNWNDGMWQYLPIALKQARKEGRLKLEGVKRDDSSRKSSGSDGAHSKRVRKPRAARRVTKTDSSSGEAAS